MSPVGPQLPKTSLEKRKRDTQREDSSSSDSDTGAAPSPQSTGTTTKKPRVIGPSLPPPTLEDDASHKSESDDESSDDDGFGPSLPPMSSNTSSATASKSIPGPQLPSAPAAVSKRDDWMMVPPSGGDWSARVDPTKLKNRKFNTGKGAKGPPSSRGGASDSWHETPQEKQARLQREMMGVKESSTQKESSLQSLTGNFDAETAKRLQEYNKSRGPSLYDKHHQSKTVEQDDDPSARAFDREKDVGGGLQINATQRRDMMKKASDFGSRFSSAKYL